jgi:hypothetical protein
LILEQQLKMRRQQDSQQAAQQALMNLQNKLKQDST